MGIEQMKRSILEKLNEKPSNFQTVDTLPGCGEKDFPGCLIELKDDGFVEGKDIAPFEIDAPFFMARITGHGIKFLRS